MKIVTASNGKKTIKMSKKEWQSIGKKAGWTKKAEGGNREMKKEMISYLQSIYGNEDLFSIEAAIYWYASDYHSGQWSDLYSILSTSKYRPRASIGNIKDEDEDTQNMYKSLVEHFENNQQDILV